MSCDDGLGKLESWEARSVRLDCERQAHILVLQPSRDILAPDEDDATLALVHDGAKKWIEARLQG